MNNQNNSSFAPFLKISDELYRYNAKRISPSLFSELTLPVTLFHTQELSSLEAICKYLKEHIGLSFRDISGLLNRDERTIWNAYTCAQKKHPQSLIIEQTSYQIPLHILTHRVLSVLESISEYLKDYYHLKYSQIGPLVNRDQRTIWTVYKRAKRKRNAAA